MGLTDDDAEVGLVESGVGVSHVTRDAARDSELELGPIREHEIVLVVARRSP